jgi:hypothetical protein
MLARKHGALRSGAPFKDWVLPAAMERIRPRLAGGDALARSACELVHMAGVA